MEEKNCELRQIFVCELKLYCQMGASENKHGKSRGSEVSNMLHRQNIHGS